MSEIKLDLITEAKKMLERLMGDGAPTIVIVPRTNFILMHYPEENESVEKYMQRVLRESLFKCNEDTFHEKSAEIYTKLYLMEKEFETEVGRKADRSMELVSKWRGKS